MSSALVQIEHTSVAGSAWVPEDAFTTFWGPVEGWTLVAGSPVTYLPAPMRYRGVYSSGITYDPGDVVTVAGAAYIALVPVVGVNPPSDATKWALAISADPTAFALVGDAASAGALATSALLKAWTSADAYELLSITMDENDVITSATVKWPDGSAGTFTATTVNSTFHVIDAFTVTHTLSGKTVTQAAVTRNADGYPTTFPALTVA
jgi:hypothetical protein